MKWFSGQWGKLPKALVTYPVAGMGGIFVAGAVFWGGFNWSMELTNTEEFCISCHAMRAYPYAEYKNTIHYSNHTGVHASCPDCHVPKEWIYKVVRKVRATNELFHWLQGSIDSKAAFEAKRPELARHVWAGMEATDSRECRNCHAMNFMSREIQGTMARNMHALAEEWGNTCIDCHKGIAHTLPRGFDAEAITDKLHDRMKAEGRDCRQCHEDMAGPPPGQGW